MESQNKMIMGHLRRHKSITPLTAMSQYNCMRLAARIFDLKEAGHTINKEMVETHSGKQIARYTLIKEATQ